MESRHFIIQKDVNIYKYPTVIRTHKPGSVIMLGDIHACLMKLAFFLVSEGILDVTEKEYERLAQIYDIPISHITSKELLEFKQLISSFKIKDPLPEICFIGDDVVDRGKNDSYIFKVFEKLSLENVKFEILGSNHGVQFLTQFAYGLDKENVTMFNYGHQAYGASLHNMQTLIKDGKVDVEEINSIIKQHYLPRLKLLSYVMKDENTITILSHAPIDDSALESVADLFGIPYKITPKEIAQMIDKINEIFQLLCDVPINHTKPDKLKRLAELVGVTYQSDELQKTIANINQRFHYRINITNGNFLPNISTITVLEKLVNDRYSDIATRNERKRSKANLNIHGHVLFEVFPYYRTTDWKYINLDGMLGHSDQKIGEYKVYVANAGYRTELKKDTSEKTISASVRNDINDVPLIVEKQPQVKLPKIKKTASISLSHTPKHQLQKILAKYSATVKELTITYDNIHFPFTNEELKSHLIHLPFTMKTVIFQQQNGEQIRINLDQYRKDNYFPDSYFDIANAAKNPNLDYKTELFNQTKAILSDYTKRDDFWPGLTLFLSCHLGRNFIDEVNACLDKNLNFDDLLAGIKNLQKQNIQNGNFNHIGSLARRIRYIELLHENAMRLNENVKEYKVKI